jgi:hypothetical protein
LIRIRRRWTIIDTITDPIVIPIGASFAYIANPIPIRISLIRVGIGWAVIVLITHAIVILVRTGWFTIGADRLDVLFTTEDKDTYIASAACWNGEQGLLPRIRI